MEFEVPRAYFTTQGVSVRRDVDYAPPYEKPSRARFNLSLVLSLEGVTGASMSAPRALPEQLPERSGSQGKGR